MRIAIVGDGPGGLSAALFLAKAGHSVVLYGQNKTAMHFAYLYNYLGIVGMSGTEFQEIAREQVSSFGAELIDEQVVEVNNDEDQFVVVTEKGTQLQADYLILNEGKNAPLAQKMSLDGSGDEIKVDKNGRTDVKGLYVIGRSARPARSQAIITAGDGAAAALDIMSTIEGKDVQDWDTPEKT
ncbi:MAG: FAD-dependent oxidoreductase [Candidatus Latescibacterota bacterium]|nr:FAD-dependent oxidoreductase [Candidatus Latescibacterota bacterium]